jgi:hypothetical protein
VSKNLNPLQGPLLSNEQKIFIFKSLLEGKQGQHYDFTYGWVDGDIYYIMQCVISGYPVRVVKARKTK